jgi:opacity protein-like surface antigen
MKRISLALFFCFIATGLVFGQGLGFYAIGGGLGFVNVSNSGESLSGFGFNARANLGDITSNLRLVPEIYYWSTSKDFGEGVEWKFSDFALNANVQYRFEMEGSFEPYVGGGLGLNFVSSTVSASIPFFGTSSFSATTTEFGLNLLGGANFNMAGKIVPWGEVRYVIVSNMNHFMITAGILYYL